MPSPVLPFPLINMLVIKKKPFCFHYIHYFIPSDAITRRLYLSMQCRQIMVGGRGWQGAAPCLCTPLSPDAGSGLDLGMSYANIKMP